MIVSSSLAALWTLTTRRRGGLPSLPSSVRPRENLVATNRALQRGSSGSLPILPYLQNLHPTRTSRPSFPPAPRSQNYHKSLTACVNRPAKKRKERKEFNHRTQVCPICRSWKKSQTGNKRKRFSTQHCFLLSNLSFSLPQTIKEDLSLRPPHCGLLLDCHMRVSGEGGRVSQSAPFHRFVSLSPFFPFFLSLVLHLPA